MFFTSRIGVFLAVVLHQKFIRGKSAWRVLLILPWALPQYICALTWRGMFNYEYGAVNLLITKYLHMSPVQWLTSPFEAFLAVIITNIWLGFPFMMVIALGGLQSIPEELYEAAEVDGASKWFQFWNITAPLLRPVMIPAITLGVIWTFNNINVVWLVSNMGEPADSTHILVSYVYKAAFNMYRFGWAAALSVVIFAILLPFRRSSRKGPARPNRFIRGAAGFQRSKSRREPDKTARPPSGRFHKGRACRVRFALLCRIHLHLEIARGQRGNFVNWNAIPERFRNAATAGCGFVFNHTVAQIDVRFRIRGVEPERA